MNQYLKDLTDREKDILRLLARGHDAKSAASALEVSVNSINERLREARRKLGTTSSREAARILMEAEGGSSQEIRDEKMGLDEQPAEVANDARPVTNGVKQVTLLTSLGVGRMLVVALVLLLSSGLADNQVGGSEASSSSPAAASSSGNLSASQRLRPTYLVALDGTLAGHSIAQQRMTISSGSMASVSSAGAYDMHFVVTPDPENEGKLLVSVNVVIPGQAATSRYSRSLSVAEGQAANFELEAIGTSSSPGAVAITLYRVEPQS